MKHIIAISVLALGLFTNSVANAAIVNQTAAVSNCRKEKSSVITHYQKNKRVTIHPGVLTGKIILPVDAHITLSSLEVDSGVIDSSLVKKDGTFCVVGNTSINAGMLTIGNKEGNVFLSKIITPRSYKSPFIVDRDTSAITHLALAFAPYNILEKNSDRIIDLATTLPESKLYQAAYMAKWSPLLRDEYEVLLKEDVNTLLEKARQAIEKKLLAGKSFEQFLHEQSSRH